MMNQNLKILAIVLVMAMFCLPSCGGGANGSSRKGDVTSSESLSDYVGKWELFQVGDTPTESVTFILKITSGGGASISCYESKLGQGNTWLISGDGYVELNGENLYVELTSGDSKGYSLNLIARDGRIYTTGGESFSKK